MSINIPDFDPYTVLGVDKDAPSSAIKSAYRKLVLKCHPDKIQDEALRATAVIEFQKLQESYEILSDEGRRQLYDQEIYLNKLRKETAAQKAYASRECRDGQMYEERVPAGAAFFNSSDEHLYTEEPISYSQKYADGSKRPHTKATEERKKAKGPSVYTYTTTRPAKQSDRDHVKAAHYDRARTRTKERRRDASDKYERTAPGFDSESDDAYSDLEREQVHYRTKVEVETRYSSPRESVPPRRKTDTTSSYSPKHHRSHGSSASSDSEDGHDDYTSYSASKLDGQEEWAKKYIGRTTDPVIRPHSSRHAGYEDRERRHSETPRYSGRSSHSYKESVHVETSSPRTTRRSYERLDSPERGNERGYDYERAYERERDRDRDRDRRWERELDRELDRRERERERGRTVPSLSTAASQKVPSSTRAPPTITRSATAPYPSRSRREASNRSESKGPLSGIVTGLASMVVDGFAGDAKVSSRSSTGRGVSRARGVSRPRGTEKNDSGYSSGPSTPEMPQNASAKIKQYKIVETSDRTKVETVDVYPSPPPPPPPPVPSSSSRSERPRERSTAPRPKTTTRTKTYTYEPEIITRQPASASPKTSSAGRHLYGEIRPEILDGHRYTRPTVA
ncbi:hypothetical protein EYB26_000875 [Talaromyces marneffei]|uniref:uncharacterized protein n=1 Tax=Talaromyces marneffei TaxID=37727 RepID=UPI0012A9BD74|nr:uncharacterized protein EYB26_000875 [Talaromyces marneffei]QGA13228.1 hypothetical protein EYB26_000875 [Talaromyces marneffei]